MYPRCQILGYWSILLTHMKLHVIQVQAYSRVSAKSGKSGNSILSKKVWKRQRNVREFQCFVKMSGKIHCGLCHCENSMRYIKKNCLPRAFCFLILQNFPRDVKYESKKCQGKRHLSGKSQGNVRENGLWILADNPPCIGFPLNIAGYSAKTLVI